MVIPGRCRSYKPLGRRHGAESKTCGRRPMAVASVLVGAGCLDLGGRSRGIAQTKESPDLVDAAS